MKVFSPAAWPPSPTTETWSRFRYDNWKVVFTGRGEEGRQPVEMAHDLVRDDAGRDLPGPADDERDAESALPVRVLLRPERCHASVRPRVHVHAVVGRVHDDRVLGEAQLVDGVEHPADELVVVDHRVVVGRLPPSRLTDAPSLGMRAEVHVRGVHPGEEGLAGLVLTLDEVDRRIDDLVVDRLHPLPGQRARVLDLVLSAPGDPAPQDPARPEALTEVRVLLRVRVIGVLRLLLGIQVVEVAEELVEAVGRRKVLVAVAEVVLAELARRVSERLQELGDGRVLRLHPLLGAR
jgi:hypothetical protein